MLSLHTNSATLAAQRSLDRTQQNLSQSQTRLSTGYRINSAQDDAAGAQIASRLNAQNHGGAVALRNVQNSISMLQTAEGALQEFDNIQRRMKELAIQAADASTTDADKAALDAEFNQLYDQFFQIAENTTFGGTQLLMEPNGNWASGKLFSTMTFQVGAGANDTLAADLSQQTLGAVVSMFSPAAFTWETVLMTNPSVALGALDKGIDATAALRSGIGALVNQLDHAGNNLNTLQINTASALGRYRDADYATEAAVMASAQMLQQSGTAMLKQGGDMTKLVLALVQ
jgi:flagellin